MLISDRSDIVNSGFFTRTGVASQFNRITNPHCVVAVRPYVSARCVAVDYYTRCALAWDYAYKTVNTNTVFDPAHGLGIKGEGVFNLSKLKGRLNVAGLPNPTTNTFSIATLVRPYWQNQYDERLEPLLGRRSPAGNRAGHVIATEKNNVYFMVGSSAGDLVHNGTDSVFDGNLISGLYGAALQPHWIVGVTSNNDGFLYVDGELVATKTWSAFRPLDANSTAYRVGIPPSPYGEYEWYGSYLFSRALSQSEVRLLNNHSSDFLFG